MVNERMPRTYKTRLNESLDQLEKYYEAMPHRGHRYMLWNVQNVLRQQTFTDFMDQYKSFFQKYFLTQTYVENPFLWVASEFLQNAKNMRVLREGMYHRYTFEGVEKILTLLKQGIPLESRPEWEGLQLKHFTHSPITFSPLELEFLRGITHRPSVLDILNGRVEQLGHNLPPLDTRLMGGLLDDV